MRGRPRALAVVAGVALTILLAGWKAAPQAAVGDPERTSTELAQWYWYTGVGESALSAQISSKGLRIVDLEVESPTKFTATLVKNSGVFQRQWWWFYGLTDSQVTSKISSLGARIVDLEPYSTSSGTRFAVVMVRNAGSAAKSWWWYFGLTPDQITSKLTANGARLVDLDAMGGGKYAVVMIRNTGVDATQWWWYYNVSPDFVSSKLSANKAQLISIERPSSGKLDVIMVKRVSSYWWWYFGQSRDEVTKLAIQNGARAVQVTPYESGGSKVFAVVMVNDTTDENSRLREIMAKGLTGAGGYGFFLKRVGSSVVSALNENYVFDPASSLKVVHVLHAMRQDGSNIDTTNFITYYVKPDDTSNKDVCPDPAWESNSTLARKTTLRDAIGRTLKNSDNRTTRAFVVKYGFSGLNTFANSTVHMDSTTLRQNIGCGYNGGKKNDVTLADFGKIYEGISNGTLISGANRTTLWSLLLGGNVDPAGTLGQIVKDEATKLGKTAAVATQFAQNMETRSKGGSYDICGATCNPYLYVRSAAGRITIPFKSGGNITGVDYVYSRFVSDLSIPCQVKGASETGAQAEARCAAYKAANKAFNGAGNELLRPVIREALKTWP